MERALFRPVPARPARGGTRAWTGLVVMAALGLLWLGLASRVHVNTNWSDDAWGYLVLPAGDPAIGDAVLFEPPPCLDAPVPYLKTVRGLPGSVVRGVLEERPYTDWRGPACPGLVSHGRIGIWRHSEWTDRPDFKGQANEEVGADGVHI